MPHKGTIEDKSLIISLIYEIVYKAPPGVLPDHPYNNTMNFFKRSHTNAVLPHSPKAAVTEYPKRMLY
jgi:hypothetical protein